KLPQPPLTIKLFPYTTLFRSQGNAETGPVRHRNNALVDDRLLDAFHQIAPPRHVHGVIRHYEKVFSRRGAMHVCHTGNRRAGKVDRKSTRLNSSHVANSYAVF